MRNQLRRDFLVAARGHKNWYTAVTKAKAQEFHARGRDVIFLTNPRQYTHDYSGADHLNFMYQVIDESAAIKKDLAQALAGHLIANPEETATIADIVEDKERHLRLRTLDISVRERPRKDGTIHTDEVNWKDLVHEAFDTPEEAEAFLNDLDVLRRFPDDAFDVTFYARDPIKITNKVAVAMRDISDLVNESHATLTKGDHKKITDALNKLPAHDMIKIADLCEFDYGDHGHDNKTAAFNITASAIRHWPDINKDKRGNLIHGFAIGTSENRRIFIEGDFARKNGEQWTPDDDDNIPPARRLGSGGPAA